MSDDLLMTPAALGALAAGDLEHFMVAATPGGIEAQEARGQRDFVASATLPLDLGRNTREQFESLGFVFGEPVDDLFQNATLPEGWTKVATDHSMWSRLIDAEGRERSMIFYKAAFYDREAFMNLVRRFSWGTRHEGGYEIGYDERIATPCTGYVERSGEVVFETEPAIVTNTEGIGINYKKRGLLETQAREWLETNYPDWENPLAYWDSSEHKEE